MKQKTQKYTNFCIRCNSEEKEILQKLKTKHGINISGTFKLFIKQKLQMLEHLEKLEN